MKYNQQIILKNGENAVLRNGEESDGIAVFENITRRTQKQIICFPIQTKTALILRKRDNF